MATGDRGCVAERRRKRIARAFLAGTANLADGRLAGEDVGVADDASGRSDGINRDLDLEVWNAGARRDVETDRHGIRGEFECGLGAGWREHTVEGAGIAGGGRIATEDLADRVETEREVEGADQIVRGIATGIGGKGGDYLAGGVEDFEAPRAGGGIDISVEVHGDVDIAHVSEAGLSAGKNLTTEGDIEADGAFGFAGDEDGAFGDVGRGRVNRSNTGKRTAFDVEVKAGKRGRLAFDADAEGGEFADRHGI